MDLRYVCFDCGQRQPGPGRCPGCGDSPLLDLEDGGVRIALEDDDFRRRTERDRTFTALCVPVALVLGVSLLFVPGFTTLLGLVPGPNFLKIIFGMAGMGYGLSRLLLMVFPPRLRFPYLAR